MNHRWNNNTCIKCNCRKKRQTVRVLMAVVNHPPWEAYRSETVTLYLPADKTIWSYKRPDCKPPENKPEIKTENKVSIWWPGGMPDQLKK